MRFKYPRTLGSTKPNKRELNAWRKAFVTDVVTPPRYEDEQHKIVNESLHHPPPGETSTVTPPHWMPPHASESPVQIVDADVDIDVRSTPPTYPVGWAGIIARSKEFPGVKNVKGSGYSATEIEDGSETGMHRDKDVVGNFSHDNGRFNFWVEHSPNSYMIYRSDLGQKATTPTQVAAYPTSKDSYYHYATDGRTFTVYKTTKGQLDMQVTSDGAKAGRAASKQATSTADRLKAINASNRKAWSS
jgi:hypothetical protein